LLPLTFCGKADKFQPAYFIVMDPTTPAQPRFWRRPEFLLVVAAFALRVAYMLAGHTYHFPATNNHFYFGFETGSIAGAIARGEGFSSPFWRPSGPTAWIGPIYPYLLAGIFKIWGIFTDGSAIAILTINSLFAAFTTWSIYEIGEDVFGRRAALVAAALWAVVPFFFRYAITWVWDPPVSAFLLSCGVLCVLRIRSTDWKHWAGLGVLAGFSALVNPALTTLFPVLILWAGWKIWRSGNRQFAPVLIALLTMATCMSPWLIRNRLVFGEWVFIRSNAPFEFSLGNFPGSPGVAFSGAHPAINPRVFNDYVRMGEIKFVKAKGDEAKSWAKEHSVEFAKLSCKRVVDFWDGGELLYEPADDPWSPWMVTLESAIALAGLALAGWKRMRGTTPIALLMLLYPLPYYFVYTNPRYRHALEPLMVILIGYLVVSVWDAILRPAPAKTKAKAATV
jgi:4-amino-4-deoxy-L-arabinose transferase-like glycosyltransferase